MRDVVVIAGGDEPPPEHAALVAPTAAVIAADSGLVNAEALHLTVHHAVGDFDSTPDAVVARAVAAGVEIHRDRPDKDATDLELALDAVAELVPDRLLVLGGGGGRLDHLLANLAALGRPSLDGIEVEARFGPATVWIARSGVPVTVPAARGELVSLLALHGTVAGVRTEGLLYPLRDEPLEAGSGRGMSNEVTQSPASVEVGSGVVTVVRPGDTGTHLARGLGPKG